MKSAQKIHASTQKFTEIKDIIDDVVLLNGDYACSIIEVQATNFTLLSQEEQMAKISSYAALLNSLSFSIQILIRNKRVDISSYLKLLDDEIQRVRIATSADDSGQGEKLSNYIKQYRDFVQDMIKINIVLDKNFYIIISYSFLEKGLSVSKKDDFQSLAKTSLHTKAESLLSQLARLSLHAKVLDKEELIKLFYDIYNQSESEVHGLSETIETTMVKGG